MWRAVGSHSVCYQRSCIYSHLIVARVVLMTKNNIAFKAANRDFFFNNLLTAPRTISNTYTTLKRPGSNRVQITYNTSSAYHVQHVVLRATQYEGSAQLLSLTEFKSHLFSFILLAEPFSRRRRGGNRSTRRQPLATSFRQCHILKSTKIQAPSVGGRPGKQKC